MTKKMLMLGGPGLAGYVYQYDVYCVPCGHSIIEGLPDREYDDEYEANDSDTVPVPVFFPECEHPQYCGSCGAYVYGGVCD